MTAAAITGRPAPEAELTDAAQLDLRDAFPGFEPTPEGQHAEQIADVRQRFADLGALFAESRP